MSEAIDQSKEEALALKPKKYMVFHLAGLRYAAPLASVKEVVALSTLTPVPGMPVYFRGLINLRGKIISTIDLKLRLNLKEEKSEHAQKRPTVIVTQTGEEPLGLIVDDVSEVLSFTDSQIDRQIEKLEDSVKQGVIGAARMDNKDLTLILDLAKLSKIGSRAHAA
jgi:purine-binding chemotaxis protein CheW